MTWQAWMTLALIVGLYLTIPLTGWMAKRIVRNVAQQAVYDAEMYRQVAAVIEDLISISPEKAEGLEVALLEIQEAERQAKKRTHLTLRKAIQR